jgi:Tol biopolymer transport system component
LAFIVADLWKLPPGNPPGGSRLEMDIQYGLRIVFCRVYRRLDKQSIFMQEYQNQTISPAEKSPGGIVGIFTTDADSPRRTGTYGEFGMKQGGILKWRFTLLALGTGLLVCAGCARPGAEEAKKATAWPTWTPLPSRPIASITSTPMPTMPPAAASTSPTDTTAPTNPGGNGGEFLAFVSWSGNTGEIYIVDSDGNPTRLSGDAAGESGTAWSPDGTRIAFTSLHDGNPEIYLVDVDGSRLTNLTNNPGADTDPTWSPDGTRIAFVSDRDGNGEIYAMDADGTNVSRLTDDPGKDSYPSWSPKGDRIAFLSSRGEDSEYFKSLYIMNPDGSNVSRPIPDWEYVYDCAPVWSPDGGKIAFVSNFSDISDITVVGADGSDEIEITDPGVGQVEEAFDFDPAWSPDGLHIAFSSNRDDPRPASCDSSPEGCIFNIYIVYADGMYETPLTSGGSVDMNPVWSPDGHFIAFLSDRGGDVQVYIVSAKGGDLFQLTDIPSSKFGLTWQPRAS